MKKVLYLSAFVLFFLSGCGSSVENKNAAIADGATPAPSIAISTPAPTETPATGVRIDRAETTRFSDGVIPTGWQWVDPGKDAKPTRYESKGGGFVITVPSGKDLYGDNLTAPRLLKSVTGDFQIETRVAFDPKEDYQGAGLVIYVDGINYLRLERSYGGLGDGGSGIRFDVRKYDQYVPLTTPGEVPTIAGEVELKIVRRGHIFTAFWRQDENAEWREVEEFASDFPETVQAGIIGCSTASEITARFASIRLLPQPVTKPF